MLQTNIGAAPVNYTYSPGAPPTVFGPDVCMEVDSQASLRLAKAKAYVRTRVRVGVNLDSWRR